MAFVNLPPNFQDIFAKIDDRLSKLETGPNQAMYTAVGASVQATNAQTQATQALAEAAQALTQAQGSYVIASQAIIKSAQTITNAQNQLTAINGNGITVYSGASQSSGARVVLNSAGIIGYKSSSTGAGNGATFTLDATNGNVSMTGASFTEGTIYGGSLNINGNAIISSQGILTAYGATIQGTITANAGSFTGTVNANSGSFTGSIYGSSGNIGGWNFNSTGLYNSSATASIASSNGAIVSTGTSYLKALAINGATIGTNNLAVSGNTNVTGEIIATNNITSQTHFYTPFATTTSSVANTFINTGSTPAGRIMRSTASSQRYKENIVNLTTVPELDPQKLYELPVRAFTYKEGYLDSSDDRYGIMIPGFIAEEMDAIYPIAADYVDGVETWNDRMLVPAMLSLIQDLNQRVIELESKVQ